MLFLCIFFIDSLLFEAFTNSLSIMYSNFSSIFVFAVHIVSMALIKYPAPSADLFDNRVSFNNIRFIDTHLLPPILTNQKITNDVSL